MQDERNCGGCHVWGYRSRRKLCSQSIDDAPASPKYNTASTARDHVLNIEDIAATRGAGCASLSVVKNVSAATLVPASLWPLSAGAQSIEHSECANVQHSETHDPGHGSDVQGERAAYMCTYSLDLNLQRKNHLYTNVQPVKATQKKHRLSACLLSLYCHGVVMIAA